MFFGDIVYYCILFFFCVNVYYYFEGFNMIYSELGDYIYVCLE